MDMTSSKHSSALQLDEAAKLKEIFEARQQSARLKGKRLTQVDVGIACGWTSAQSVVSQLMSGRMPLGIETLIKLAYVLKFHPKEVSPRLAVTIDLLSKIKDSGLLHPEVVSESFRLPVTTGCIPVTFKARVSSNGAYTPEAQEMETPFGLLNIYSKDPGAFGIMITGNALSPRLKSHEFLVVEPGREPVAGDDVVVVLNDGTCLIREFIFSRDGHFRLDSLIQGSDSLYLEESDVNRIHYIDAIVKKTRYEPS